MAWRAVAPSYLRSRVQDKTSCQGICETRTWLDAAEAPATAILTARRDTLTAMAADLEKVGLEGPRLEAWLDYARNTCAREGPSIDRDPEAGPSKGTDGSNPHAMR